MHVMFETNDLKILGNVLSFDFTMIGWSKTINKVNGQFFFSHHSIWKLVYRMKEFECNKNVKEKKPLI